MRCRPEPLEPEFCWPRYFLSATSEVIDSAELGDEVSLGHDPQSFLTGLGLALKPGFYVLRVRRGQRVELVDWGGMTVRRAGVWQLRSLDGRVIAGPGFVWGGRGEWSSRLVVPERAWG